MYYTGIGSRTPPKQILDKMVVYGVLLANLGFTLRSGGSNGSDCAFERGCDLVDGKKEIYLPWKKFNNHPSPLYQFDYKVHQCARLMYLSLNQYDNLKHSSKQFMARNCQQVTGKNLDIPSDFVICWTSDGAENHLQRTKQTGGTGQAISYASYLTIPVYNLYNPESEQRFFDHIKCHIIH